MIVPLPNVQPHGPVFASSLPVSGEGVTSTVWADADEVASKHATVIAAPENARNERSMLAVYTKGAAFGAPALAGYQGNGEAK